jgi:Ala-tRNA(Pro) deacylase
MESLYQNIIKLLNEHNIRFREYDHDPILSYNDAEKEKARFGWVGVESKNVFLKGNDKKYYLYVTIQGKRVDFSLLKSILGTKVSIASEEDVRNVISCTPGCVAPFGFSEDITIIIDPSIYEFSDYLFSPGVTTKTIQTNIQDLKNLFTHLPNKVILL